MQRRERSLDRIDARVLLFLDPLLGAEVAVGGCAVKAHFVVAGSQCEKDAQVTAEGDSGAQGTSGGTGRSRAGVLSVRSSGRYLSVRRADPSMCAGRPRRADVYTSMEGVDIL